MATRTYPGGGNVCPERVPKGWPAVAVNAAVRRTAFATRILAVSHARRVQAVIPRRATRAAAGDRPDARDSSSCTPHHSARRPVRGDGKEDTSGYAPERVLVDGVRPSAEATAQLARAGTNAHVYAWCACRLASTTPDGAHAQRSSPTILRRQLTHRVPSARFARARCARVTRVRLGDSTTAATRHRTAIDRPVLPVNATRPVTLAGHGASMDSE